MSSAVRTLAAGAVVSADQFFVEYIDVDGAARRESLSRCGGVRFEDVAPARSFPTFTGQRNFPGRWWSSTVGRHVGYESWLERDHVMLLDFDPAVVGIASQPFLLFWPAADGVRRHLPDYFVRGDDGSAVVIDVRPDERVSAGDAETFAVTARACEAVGWRFRRVGTVEPVFAANVRWLSRYRHPRCGRREDLALRLLEVFAEPTALLPGAQEAGDQLVTLPMLFHLLWRQIMTADLTNTLLGAGTVVQTAEAR